MPAKYSIRKKTNVSRSDKLTPSLHRQTQLQAASLAHDAIVRAPVDLSTNLSGQLVRSSVTAFHSMFSKHPAIASAKTAKAKRDLIIAAKVVVVVR